ncbi:MAG: type II secretion system F family protein [Actinobacteria bacterium]|nr:type II secretion system F family protein [Actinomycetota bacterium]
MIDSMARATALRALASLLRTGLTVRQALMSWSSEAAVELVPHLQRLARRLRLGDGIESAAASLEACMEEDALALVCVLGVHRRMGGDIACNLDALAGAIEERCAWAGAARSAGAGALLSGRLVAGLPFAFLPLAPVARAPLFDGPGVALLVAGLASGVCGLIWIARLVPRPPSAEDSISFIARVVSRALLGGAPLRVAMQVVTENAPSDLRVPLERARRSVMLGGTWARALELTGDDRLLVLARAVGRAERAGLPVAAALDELVLRRRAEAARAFDASVRRSPVLMVVPLVTCVLPSFLLLGIAPFLRSFAFS